MDEQEWLGCTDPRRVLGSLRSSGKANVRRLKLWVLAYLRWTALHYSPSLTDDALRAAEAKVEREEETSGRLGQAWIAAGSLLKEAAERGVLCSFLRDLFGPLPFRPVSVDPAWLSPDVLSLAQAAYEHRTLPAGTLEPARLALLADALEEAGCANTDVLGHLRGPGPHVRGCHAVDLCLGRE
jgi:hypothetical protein